MKLKIGGYMGIVSNYVWERAADGRANPVSLVLQQVKVRGREIALFCVCNSPAGANTDISHPLLMDAIPRRKPTVCTEKESLTEGLTEWFHRECLPACEGRNAQTPQELLEPELRRVCGELPRQETWKYCALLLVGNAFYLCGDGDVAAQLVNYRYNHPRMKRLATPLHGRIQRGAGLLLYTPELIKNLEQEEVCQILHGEGLRREEGIGRRLRELYREGRSRGNTGPVGGIYLQIP